MAQITCYRCFVQFSPRRLHFKCHQHGGQDDVLGNQAFNIFPWRPRPWQFHPPRQAICPVCRYFTSYRVCPTCRQDLPHYVGRVCQQIIAVTGCRASGKSIYHWSVLHQLRERLSAESNAYAASMFEDDASHQTYLEFDSTIRFSNQLPTLTQMQEMKSGKFDPIIVRLMQIGRRPGSHTNLIFYDHAGELIEALSAVEYLRYLAHAGGIIFLVDPVDQDDQSRDGLSAIIDKVRRELRISRKKLIDQPLAIAISKSDRQLFPEMIARHGRGAVLFDAESGANFWRTPAAQRRRRIAETSGLCRDYLQQTLGMHSLVALAENNFRQVRYFAVSALNGALDEQKQFTRAPVPLAVEHPLFWLLGELN